MTHGFCPASVLSIFRIIAPDFSDIDDNIINSWITLTDPLISSRKFGRLYAQALALLTAHRMYVAGVGSECTHEGLGSMAAGKMRHIASYSEGQVSVSFNHEQGDLDTDGDAYYGLSKYGIEFIKLRDSVIMPITSTAMRRR